MKMGEDEITNSGAPYFNNEEATAYSDVDYVPLDVEVVVSDDILELDKLKSQFEDLSLGLLVGNNKLGLKDETEEQADEEGEALEEGVEADELSGDVTDFRDENTEFFDEFSRIRDRLHEKTQGDESVNGVSARRLATDRKRPASLAGDSTPPDADSPFNSVPRPKPRLRQTAQLKKFAKAARVVAILTGEAAKKAESLYEEALYYACHPIGPDASDISSNHEDLLKYLRSAFSISEEKQEAYIEAVNEKTGPQVLLKISLIEARNLRGKDVNGMSDPYCIMSTSGNPSFKVTSSYKETELNPVWKESFALEVHNAHSENLHIDIFDYDPEESVKEKLGHLADIKSAKSFGRLFKDITGLKGSASGVKNNHEYLGHVTIPLKSVPASGIERWYVIEGRNMEEKTKKNRGEMRLHLSLASGVAKALHTLPAMIKHEQFIRYVYDFEIRKDEDWFGMLPAEARQIIVQHACHHGLTSYDSDLVRWKALFDINEHRALDPLQILPLLERIKRSYEEDKYTIDQAEYLLRSMDKFVDYCLNISKKHRKVHPELAGPEQLKCLMKCLSAVVQLDFKANGSPRLRDLRERMQLTVLSGTAEWIQYVIDTTKKEGCDVGVRLEHAISVCINSTADLRRALDYYNVIFCEFLDVPYFMLVYQILDQKLAEISRDVVEEATSAFAELLLDGSGKKEGIALGASLFELYLLLQQFHRLSSPFPPETISQMCLYGYSKWFSAAVTKWLQIATIKALNLIEKAVEIDSLKQIDQYHKYSTSALDCVQIFHQVKTSWKQLAWSDPEESLAYVLKILEDICKSADFYSVSMATKLDKLLKEQVNIKVTEEVFMAVNDILYIRDSLAPLVLELGLTMSADEPPTSSLLLALVARHNEESAMRHVDTVKALIGNCVEAMETRVNEMWDALGDSLMPEVLRLTRFACDNLENKDLLLDRFDGSLKMACEKCFNDDLFQHCLRVHCELAWKCFCKVILEQIEDKQPPGHFQNISSLVNAACTFFYTDENPPLSDDLMGGALLKEVRYWLDIYAADTWQIVQRYLLHRYESQQEVAETPYGALTVRAMFAGPILLVEVLNAKKLMKMDIGGKADPYVKVRLEPATRFPESAKQKTKVVKNNIFPLFDETFVYSVAPALQTSDGLVVFTVKDYDMVGSSDFMGEAFLHFKDIARGDGRGALLEMSQIILPLTKPNDTEDNKLLETLELRSWDKAAKDFAKREKKNSEQKPKSPKSPKSK